MIQTKARRQECQIMVRDDEASQLRGGVGPGGEERVKRLAALEVENRA